MVAEGNDALLEEFFDKGTLPVEQFSTGCATRCAACASSRCCAPPALHNVGERPDPEFRDREFPQSRRARAVERKAQRQGSRARGEGFRAGLGVRLQDRRRSVRRPRVVFQSDLRRAQERRQPGERAHRRGGAAGAHRRAVRQDHSAGDRAARRRYRRRREAEGHADRRHAGRQSLADRLSGRAVCPSPPSPTPSPPRRATTKTAWATRSTRFWKKTSRCASIAIRRPRNFCWPAAGSSTSKSSSAA